MVLTVCGHWLPRPPGSSGPGNTSGTAGRQVARVRASRAARSPPPSPGLSGLSRQQAHTSAPSSLWAAKASQPSPAVPVRRPGRLCSGSSTWRRGSNQDTLVPSASRRSCPPPRATLLPSPSRRKRPVAPGLTCFQALTQAASRIWNVCSGPQIARPPHVWPHYLGEVPCWPAWPLHTPTPCGSHH